MKDGKCCSNENLISLILRLSMVVLFGLASYGKFAGGLENVVTNFTQMFQNTPLPGGLVALYARLIPWLEAVIAIWLLVGFGLRWAWVTTGVTLISLALGLMVAKQSAADLYIYIIVVCMGLYFSSHDCCALGGKRDCCNKE